MRGYAPGVTRLYLLLSTRRSSVSAGKGVDYYRLTQEEAALQAQFIEEFHREIRPRRHIVKSSIQSLTVNSDQARNAGSGTVKAQVFLDVPATNSPWRSGPTRTVRSDIEAISYRAGVIDIRLTAS